MNKIPEQAMLSNAALERAKEDARARAGEARARIEKYQQVLAQATEEERLLDRLLSLRQGNNNLDDRSARAPTLVATVAKHPAVERSVELFREAGHPLHISELMRLLHEDQIPVPGAGAQANLIAHLSRDDRVVRPSRGMYGLAEWGLADSRPVSRKRRRTRVSSKSQSHVRKEKVQ